MTDAPLVGRTLSDRYRIDTLLARGGMSLVYRAHDGRLERDVAIKVLVEPYATDDGFTARFLDEGRLAASLSHSSLVHVYDSGTDGEAHYIVMELLDQYRTVREELDRRGVIPPDEVLSIGQDLLGGLRVVHEHGLVHCDVKVREHHDRPRAGEADRLRDRHAAPSRRRGGHQPRVAALDVARAAARRGADARE